MPPSLLKLRALYFSGSILEGPDPTNLLKPLVEQALPLLLELMRDPVLSVKDTTSWTLGRICDVVPEPLKATDVLHVVISAIINGLAESPRVASNCCWCLISLSEHLAADDDNAATYKLSPFFDSIVTALMQSTERPGAEINFRATAHEAISMMVSNCARDCYGTVDKLLDAVMQRLDASVALQSQIVNSDDRNAYNEMQANLCSVMTVRLIGLSSYLILIDSPPPCAELHSKA